ncbi:RNA methyltransferase [Sphingomonas koreensis]|uniref:RNA methyltransferase n=1 Tax=Sphingomonas koreensis TaxID=93064 RepID=A0A1L6JGB2_9SPHN|nr:RNA methyltransferase [Sphingomonas koreensis]APR54955.1 RNA methyltransferase [Sphingomonas koreensis]MDC7811075.1 RNA methyltransferase [Sphingomonas koreensis]RSU19386.1 RNA methyltransferase [Sphingomonas koreensis]RSU28642.1 RNA methyltransferase [Sphingomonas koreensis]RSU31413.1 RNA methyltransferase [Sphingomonas koreensis]
MMREITAFSNPLVKRVRSLRDKKHRRDEGLFLAEGLRILTEAREAGHLPEYLFFAKGHDTHPLAGELIAATEAAGGEVISTDGDILSKLSGKDNPGAVVGVYRELSTDLARLDRNAAQIWLVAERLRDPGNLGTILRTADAVGAGGLILVDECVDPFSVEAVRASMGALFTIPLARAPWDEFHSWLRAGPGQLVGLALEGAVDYRAPDFSAPVFLFTGNEAQGLPPAYAAACDVRVKIPMLGKADSLNAAVATAVMAYTVLDRMRPFS